MSPVREEHSPTQLTANEVLRNIYDGEWNWRVEQFADITGVDVLINEDRPLFDHLPYAGSAAQRSRQARWADCKRSLLEIDRRSLSAAERVNYDTYFDQIATLLERQEYREFEAPANSDTAFWNDLGTIARRSFGSLEDYERWISQLHDVPRFFGEMIEVMRGGMRRGFTPPRITMLGRDASIRSVVEARAEDTPFFIPYQKAVRLPSPARERLCTAALKAIANHVQPAYAVLLGFIRDEYLPHCRDTISAEALPDGREYYRARVRQCTTLGLSPEDIHAFGHSEVARLRGEMLGIMEELKFAGCLSDFLQFLRTDSRFYARSADEMLMRAAWVAKKFDGAANGYFGLLPRMRFAIRPVPDDIAPHYTAGRALPGLYLLNTHRPESRPLFNLPALTLHESAPGHILQIALALENMTLPAFRRQTYLPAYAEGWALYCERLGEEMGLYETPYERFGMLGYQMWRAARLVVDTGMHALGWHRTQAVAYMEVNTSLPSHEISTEVDRYISYPAQALSYYLGEDVIWKARRYAEKALGTSFDIRQFHDLILSLGSVPLTVLQKCVEEFVLLKMRPPG